MGDKLLRMDEVARLLDVSEARAYELARQEILPVVRLGRQVRVDSGRLQDWINSGGQSLPGVWRREPTR